LTAQKRQYAFICLVLAILFQASGGIFAKYASLSMHGVSDIVNVFYILSLACLVLQAIVWQVVLKNYELSFAYPFISLVNFVVLFSSYALFNEGVSWANALGLALISAGLYFLSKDGAGR
jgi:multidrug transporter EmrE-like cation transporter